MGRELIQSESCSSNECLNLRVMIPPFHVPLPHNVLYMLLALLRRHALPVYKTLPLRRLVLDFLAPFSEACHRNAVPFHHLQDAVVACGSLSKEICVARNVTEAPLHTFDCHRHDYCAIVPHGLRLRVFGPGKVLIVAQRTEVFGLLPVSNVEYDGMMCAWRCDCIRWDDVFHSGTILASCTQRIFEMDVTYLREARVRATVSIFVYTRKGLAFHGR